MRIYTIGFTKKNACEFFELIKKNNIEIVLDIRLNNKSQLAGFAKGRDLDYFLSEICNCRYQHCIEFAPTEKILEGYKKGNISWDEYVEQYTTLILKRGDYKNFEDKYSDYKNICLLCSESTAIHCHRRLAAEIIAKDNKQINIKHI